MSSTPPTSSSLSQTEIDVQKLIFEYDNNKFTLDSNNRKKPLSTATWSKVLDVWRKEYPGVADPEPISQDQKDAAQNKTSTTTATNTGVTPTSTVTTTSAPPPTTSTNSMPTVITPTPQPPTNSTTPSSSQPKSSSSGSKASTTDNSSTKSSPSSSSSSIFKSMGSGSMSQKFVGITAVQREAIDASIQRVDNTISVDTRKTIITHMELLKNEWEPKITATDPKTLETQYDEIVKTYIKPAQESATNRRNMYIGLGVVGGLVLVGAGYYIWRSKNIRDAPTTIP